MPKLRCIAIILLSMSHCRPLDPCLSEDDFSVKIGDTVFVRSCAENAEIYSWEIEGERVNTFLENPKPFFSHYANSGGTPCHEFVYLIFHDTGNFQLKCTIGKLENGTCSDDLAIKKAEESTAHIHVRDTAKSN